MRRAELASIAALALAGCMKIYPDPELPDLVVEWFDGDCREETPEIALELVGLDNPASGKQLTVPCAAEQTATFADIARERYRVEGTLLDPAGTPLNMSMAEIDMRDGLDETAYLYFGGTINFRVDWTFDMGVSCASLMVDYVAIEFSPGIFSHRAPCSFGGVSGTAPDGVFTVRALAYSDETLSVVAVSPSTAELAFSFSTFTEIGTLVMSPCGSSCPEL
ncbi:MAG TPA: hypothetical protein VIV11_25440 [Kofleriaceae bacterium]